MVSAEEIDDIVVNERNLRHQIEHDIMRVDKGSSEVHFGKLYNEPLRCQFRSETSVFRSILLYKTNEASVFQSNLQWLQYSEACLTS